MAITGRERYRGAHIWLAFSDQGTGYELYEACENHAAALQALDERLRCYDLRDWAVTKDWRVLAIGHDGPRSWVRTIEGAGLKGAQLIRRESIRVELPDHDDLSEPTSTPGRSGQ